MIYKSTKNQKSKFGVETCKTLDLAYYCPGVRPM